MVTHHVKGPDTEGRRQKGLAEQGEHPGIPVSIQGFPSPPPPCCSFPSSESSPGLMAVDGPEVFFSWM